MRSKHDKFPYSLQTRTEGGVLSMGGRAFLPAGKEREGCLFWEGSLFCLRLFQELALLATNNLLATDYLLLTTHYLPSPLLRILAHAVPQRHVGCSSTRAEGSAAGRGERRARQREVAAARVPA